MANLRVQIEISKGAEKIPLNKLAPVVTDVQLFLFMLSEDLGLGVTVESWAGTDFGSSSLIFTAEKSEPVTIQQIEEFNNAFASISTEHPAPKLRRATIVQYAKIAAPIDVQEAVSFGLFPAVEDVGFGIDEIAELHGAELLPALRWIQLTKSKAAEIQAEVQANVRAYGALQGIVHSVFLGSRPPFFNLREKSTGALVKCIYGPTVYPELAAALQRMNAIIHVFGYTSTDLVDRKIEDMEVSKIVLAPVLRESEFEGLFGSDRQFTGGLTTQEFINNVRDRGHQSP
jgi:hypothetical protein